MAAATIKCTLGTVLLEGDHLGISRISITDEETNTSETIPSELKEAVLQLKEYFAGNLRQFDLRLNPEGTDFQKRVWTELQKVPFGKTISYLELSKKLGDIKAIRAVAAANGKNPLWVVVPCHRIIGSDGSLTGYAGGLWRKKWLLDHENPVKQQVLF